MKDEAVSTDPNCPKSAKSHLSSLCQTNSIVTLLAAAEPPPLPHSIPSHSQQMDSLDHVEIMDPFVRLPANSLSANKSLGSQYFWLGFPITKHENKK